MINRSQLETQIAQCLAKITPEDMQRLAEDYAMVKFPDRFPRIDGRAISKDAVSTISGWPDAWILENGKIDGVEATRRKYKNKVKEHLEEDLKNASKTPNLSGFVFVSGSPSASFSGEELAEFRTRFINDAGLEPERINLIVGNMLVRELAAPEFIRTRIDILGLYEQPEQFELFDPKLSPDERRLGSRFIPSSEDYTSGHVHRPAAADEIKELLQKHGRVLVRGIGASGKTVMAWLLAQEVADRRWPSYYLDLAELPDFGSDISNALIRDLQTYGHQQALFILDNIHLDEVLAKKVAIVWEKMVGIQRPLLLLVGRELQTSRGSAIEGLSIPVVPLKARQAEVRGVYRRLAWRHTGKTEPPEPPHNALTQWVETFGGPMDTPDTTTDLIAFSAAVLGKCSQLLKGNWDLSVNDAKEEIRNTYLLDLNDGEMSNLLRLCALAEMEVPFPKEALVDEKAGFKVTSQLMGLVFRQERGRKTKYINYRLAHAALGRLILNASYKPVDPVFERAQVAECSPYWAIVLSYRLSLVGENDEGRKIISELLNHPSRLLTLGALNYIQRALQTSLICYKVPLPSNLGKILTTQENRQRLLKIALATPLHFLAAFLKYAERTPALEDVFQSLTEGLNEKNEELLKIALATPLDSLATFLKYAERTPALEDVFQSLTEGLNEKNEELLKIALATPLHYLTIFLKYSERTPALEDVFQSLTEGLNEKNEELLKIALATPLDSLATFLKYADITSRLQEVVTSLIRGMNQSGNRKKMADLIYQAPLDKLVSIFNSETASDLWSTVLNELDTEKWNKARKKSREEFSLNAFVAFQSITTRKERPELAREPALNLLLHSTPKMWHQPGIGLHHLSHVLRCGVGASDRVIDKFLKMAATPEWVDTQYKQAPAGGLAGSLFSLATTLAPNKYDSFKRYALYKRICHEFGLFNRQDLEGKGQIISLLGSAALLGVVIDKKHFPLELKNLGYIIETRRPGSQEEPINVLQKQLWFGLREMVRMGCDLSAIPGEYAHEIYFLWKANQEDLKAIQELPPHVLKRNQDMIDWLENHFTVKSSLQG